jgi:hypothetical protein
MYYTCRIACIFCAIMSLSAMMALWVVPSPGTWIEAAVFTFLSLLTRFCMNKLKLPRLSPDVVQAGQKVMKVSGKPFLSGLRVNTVKAVVVNEQDRFKRLGASFEEDESIVNVEVLCLQPAGGI